MLKLKKEILGVIFVTTLTFPFGKEKIEHSFDDRLKAVLTSKLHSYKPAKSGSELVADAMKEPVGSERLCELAKGKKKIVIIASDHTRPVPSKDIIPNMLSEIREGNPEADIVILIATGCHRGTTKDELVFKFGEEIVKNEKIVIHDCDDKENLVTIGTLSNGLPLVINKTAAEADLLVSEGFIEPHFFAGFSGGRKSVMPGVCSRVSVMANHCSEFIASEYSRTGNLENNPIHEQMIEAAQMAGLKYIVNVVINAEKQTIYAVAGDTLAAHKKGTEFINDLCRAEAVKSDLVISTNGGYPLDQNIYQSVKGMTAAEATVKKGGVIIMIADASDGSGSNEFYHDLADCDDISATEAKMLARKNTETTPDQWESQILIRILKYARVIYISNLDDKIITDMHMTPAKSLTEALKLAEEMLGTTDYSITAIPDGVSVVVR